MLVVAVAHEIGHGVGIVDDYAYDGSGGHYIMEGAYDRGSRYNLLKEEKVDYYDQ